MFLLIVIFVYAFFKFTWSIRQFNFCTILAGAGPQRADDSERHEDFVNMITSVASLSAENHNQGLRAYYFALAALTWFLHPWLFVLTSALVAYILYQREFRSRTLHALTRPGTVETKGMSVMRPIAQHMHDLNGRGRVIDPIGLGL